MKHKKLLLSLFIILSLIFNEAVIVSAMNTGFSTNEMSTENQQIFLSNIKLSPIREEPKKGAITCFDVSNSGFIAVGFSDFGNKYISVYNSAGEFQYGYVFHANQSFGVQWDGTNILVYFVRSDVAALFDPTGTNIELRVIGNTPENNSYWTHSVFAKTRALNNHTYTVRNDLGLFNLFASSYSQLVKTDSTGDATVLYDVTSSQLTKVLAISIAVGLFVGLVVVVVVRQLAGVRRSGG